MDIQNSFRAVPLMTINAAGLVDANYTIINDPLPLPCSMITFYNTCDSRVMISFDGINNHLFLYSFTEISIQMQINALVPASISLIPKGTVFWAKTVSQAKIPEGFVAISAYSQYRN